MRKTPSQNQNFPRETEDEVSVFVKTVEEKKREKDITPSYYQGPQERVPEPVIDSNLVLEAFKNSTGLEPPKLSKPAQVSEWGSVRRRVPKDGPKRTPSKPELQGKSKENKGCLIS